MIFKSKFYNQLLTLLKKATKNQLELIQNVQKKSELMILKSCQLKKQGIIFFILINFKNYQISFINFITIDTSKTS